MRQMNSPSTYTQYETDRRDPQLVAMMAIIHQLQELNSNLEDIESAIDYQNQ